jgi:hypothetical protein
MTDRRRIDLVVTTIFEPGWLPGYLDDLRSSDLVTDVTLRIIGDRKTPASVWAAAAEAQADGFNVDCPTLDEQSDYISRLGLPDEFIPWNTDNRRNIGFLRAWEHDADVLISIDDDNFCRAGSNFFTSHLVVGHTCGEPTEHLWMIDEPWFNVCSLLEFDTMAPVYPRGFPFAARRMVTPPHSGHVDSQRVIAVNSGLWLQDPDVDAVTRLALHPIATAERGISAVLGHSTWAPINTQNTALMRDALPAFYYVRMGYPLHGLKIDRYGDILSGYFLQKCAKHLGHVTRVGSPVADHVRSPHNLLEDLHQELAGMILIEDLVPWLQDVRLTGDTYLEVYTSLADALLEQSGQFRGFVWDQGGRDFIMETADCMHQWVQTLQTLNPA